MSDLSKKQCVPCRGGVPPLTGPELDALFAQLDGGWSVVDEHHLEKEYRFDDFLPVLPRLWGAKGTRLTMLSPSR